MHRRSSFTAPIAALLLVLWAVGALGQGREFLPDLSKEREQCEGRLTGLRTTAEAWRWASIVAAVLGGLVAAGSGNQAGRTGGKTSRVWGTVALLAGGVAAASPLFPKPEDYLRQLAAADRHYVVGLKVERQIPSIQPANWPRVVAYSQARYSECLSVTPPEVPDLPSVDTGLVAMPLPAPAPSPIVLLERPMPAPPLSQRGRPQRGDAH